MTVRGRADLFFVDVGIGGADDTAVGNVGNFGDVG